MKGMFTGKPLPKDELDRWRYITSRSISLGFDTNQEKSRLSYIWGDKLNNLSEVEKLCQKASSIRDNLYERWNKLYNEIHSIIHAQGTVYGVRYYLEAGGRGISLRVIIENDLSDEEKVKYALDKELPIFVGREELSESAKNLLKDRFLGPQQSGDKYAVEAPIRDDIVKEYLHLERRFKTVNRVIFKCRFIFEHYIKKKYRHYYNKNEFWEAIIDLKLNGHTYTYLFKDREGFTLIRSPETPHVVDEGRNGEFQVAKTHY